MMVHMIHFANVVKLVLILLLDKISDKCLPILHGYSKDFFSLSIYTPKVTKQNYMQQCPGDIYYVLSGGN